MAQPCRCLATTVHFSNRCLSESVLHPNAEMLHPTAYLMARSIRQHYQEDQREVRFDFESTNGQQEPSLLLESSLRGGFGKLGMLSEDLRGTRALAVGNPKSPAAGRRGSTLVEGCKKSSETPAACCRVFLSGCFYKLGALFGCPYNKRPTNWGLYGALTLWKLPSSP